MKSRTVNESRDDRRSYPRARLHAICDFEVDGSMHEGIVIDVSPTGVFVQAEGLLSVGKEVELNLSEIDLPPVWLRARVVRVSEGNGFGLEIVSAPEYFYCMLHALSMIGIV